jgi:hypothetical protein
MPKRQKGEGDDNALQQETMDRHAAVSQTLAWLHRHQTHRHRPGGISGSALERSVVALVVTLE